MRIGTAANDVVRSARFFERVFLGDTRTDGDFVFRAVGMCMCWEGAAMVRAGWEGLGACAVAGLTVTVVCMEDGARLLGWLISVIGTLDQSRLALPGYAATGRGAYPRTRPRNTSLSSVTRRCCSMNEPVCFKKYIYLRARLRRAISTPPAIRMVPTNA